MAVGRGRTPKSAATRRAEGNSEHRPILEDITAPAGAPDMPPGLSDQAQGEFRRICDELAALKMLAVTDRASIAEYVQLWEMCRKCQEVIDRDGMTYDSEGDRNGLTIKKRPEVDIILSTRRVMLAYFDRFALNPAARAKIKVDPGKEKSERLKKFLGGGE